jgi:asparagine synthase (glutamine-hydrolysing)
MFAQQAMARQGGRLRTFSVSMPDARYDEGPVARLVADHLGTEHREFTAQPEVEQDLRLLIRSSGQPLGDSSILPTFWISRAARREATVALTGDGGDELFGGYDRYRALRLLRTHRWWMRHLPRWSGSDTRSLGDRMGRLARAARQADPARQYLTIVGMFDTEAWTAAAFDADLDPVDAARRFDFARYLPFDLLRKIDRASMACGLEVRCPMLDTTVMEQALRRTFDALCPTGQLKGLLREMAARRLPPPIARRRKSGFSIPLARWFRTTLKPMTRQWLLEVSLEPLFDRPGLERLIDEHARGKADHAQRLFALVSLSMWLAEARGT